MTVSKATLPHISVVLLDFGGVIAEEGFVNGLSTIACKNNIPLPELLRSATDAAYDSGYVLGKSNEDGFWDLLKKRMNFQGDNAAMSHTILSQFVVRDWVLHWVDQLRKRGYRVCILSDQTDWLNRLNQRMAFKQHFDHVFSSYELGKGKRDPNVFKDVVASLGIPPESTLFIDDSEENILRAESCGLTAVRFTNRQAFETLMASLVESGPESAVT